VGTHRHLKAFILLIVLLAPVFLGGCAVFDGDNRRLLNAMDAKIHPGSTGTRIALAPAAVPVGTAALAADMVLVHPVCMIPRAADDVYQLYWKPREMDWLRRVILYPVFAIATPPTFVGDWLARSLFIIRS